VQHEQASRTALLIAVAWFCLHHDPNYQGLVSKTSSDLCAQILEKHSAQNTAVLANCSAILVSAVARLIERLTIPEFWCITPYERNASESWRTQHSPTGLLKLLCLGAGFDPLSSELQQEFSAAEFWEIDHPATQRHKVRAWF